jgi:hypothetical protein
MHKQHYSTTPCVCVTQSVASNTLVVAATRTCTPSSVKQGRLSVTNTMTCMHTHAGGHVGSVRRHSVQLQAQQTRPGHLLPRQCCVFLCDSGVLPVPAQGLEALPTCCTSLPLHLHSKQPGKPLLAIILTCPTPSLCPTAHHTLSVPWPAWLVLYCLVPHGLLGTGCRSWYAPACGIITSAYLNVTCGTCNGCVAWLLGTGPLMPYCFPMSTASAGSHLHPTYPCQQLMNVLCVRQGDWMHSTVIGMLCRCPCGTAPAAAGTPPPTRTPAMRPCAARWAPPAPSTTSCTGAVCRTGTQVG